MRDRAHIPKPYARAPAHVCGHTEPVFGRHVSPTLGLTRWPSAGPILARFADLPDEEREILFETFRVWQETDASAGDAAERLCCHPNTVRFRLHRLEKRTALSFSRPRDAAELCLALEVYRRLV
jgi:PucR C-terminal helix-turn-helix domain